MKGYQHIWDIGIDADYPDPNDRYIRLTNFINISLIFFVSIPAILAVLILSNDGMPSIVRFILLIIFSGINLYLNHRRLHLLSKTLTILNPFIFIFVFPIINHFIVQGMFFWFPYGILAIGTISFHVFSFEKERNILNLFIIFFAIATFFYDSILKACAPPELDVAFIYGKNILYYQTSKGVIFLFIYTSLYAFKLSYHNSSEALLKVNKELDLLNKELKNLNQNQEDIIKDRTEKIQRQNSRIKNLAFTNSHKIRSHVTRIIGLLNFLNQQTSPEEKEFGYTKIREVADELDEVTKKLSGELIEEEE